VPVRRRRTGSETRLTTAPGSGWRDADWLDDDHVVYPAWRSSADGSSREWAVSVRRASGVGTAETIGDPGPDAISWLSARSGNRIADNRRGTDTTAGIYRASTETGAQEPYLTSAANERRPALSPDGRRIVYVSDASGSDELWVSTFPEHSTPVRLSTSGANFARWSPQGDEIFFDDGDDLFAVPVHPGAEHGPDAYGAPARLFSESTMGGAFNYYDSRGWDVGPDGQRFLVIQRYDSTIPETPIAIEHFAAWLRGR